MRRLMNSRERVPRKPLWCLLVFLLFSFLLARAQPSDEHRVARLFDADPGNIWNQIYGTLHVHAVSRETKFAGNELDPVFWPDSDYLRTSPPGK